MSGARQGSEAEGAEQPGDRDPTSAAARPREDDGLRRNRIEESVTFAPRRHLESTGGMESNGLGMSVRASAHRVIRGGSWNNDAQNVRAAYRNHNEPSNRNNNLGFRCAELTTEPDGSLLNRPASCPSSRATANGSSTAGVLVARRRRAGERSPVVFP